MKNVYASLWPAFIIFLNLFSVLKSSAQTTPATQTIQHNQTFTIASTTTFYPAGWQGWTLASTASATFRTTQPTGNSNLIASSLASNATGGVHNYNGKIGILSSATTDPALGVAISTTGFTNIQVKFDAMTIRNPWDGSTNTMINGMDLQYRVGSIFGTWTSATNMANGFYQNNTTQQIGGVTTPQNNIAQTINLPAACNNQSVVYLRWVMRDISGVGGRASFAIDNVVICPIATPTISIVGPNGTCSGQPSTFFASITNGGTAPVYAWKKNGGAVGTNSPSLTISGLIAGDQISCILTSNQGCLTSTTANSNVIAIVSGSAPVINSAIITNACNGSQNGKINLTISGGTPPYTFAWDTSNTANGPIFAVTVGIKTPANPNPGGVGLSFYIDGIETKELSLTRGISYSFNVMGGHPFHIATSVQGATSANIVTTGQTGAPTGAGTVTFKPNSIHPTPLYYPCASHEAMGWRINLNSGWNIEDPIGLKAGIYNVVVSDANGCTAAAQYTVGNVTSTLSVSANVTDASCATSRSGAINLNVSGGTPPYTVCWDTTNTNNGNQFAVTFAAKTAAHPLFGQGSAFGYVIDGVEGKALTLTRDIPYSFSVFTTNHPFRITTDLQAFQHSGIRSLEFT